MPARSARARRHAEDTDADASLDAAEAAWRGEPVAEESGETAAVSSGKKDKPGKGAAKDKNKDKGGKKAAIAAHDARLDVLEGTVADLAERLDALTRIVDEAMKASVTPRPKATAVVPRTRSRKS